MHMIAKFNLLAVVFFLNLLSHSLSLVVFSHFIIAKRKKVNRQLEGSVIFEKGESITLGIRLTVCMLCERNQGIPV